MASSVWTFYSFKPETRAELRLLAPDPALFISPHSVTRLQVGCTKTSPKRKQIVQYYVHKGSKLRREYEVENAGADGGCVILSLKTWTRCGAGGGVSGVVL